LGVGCEAGSPRGPTLKRALGRSLAACFAPPWLVHLPPDLAAAAPKGEGTRAPSRRLPPKHPAGSQHPLYKKIPRSGRKNFGRWVFDIGRWVFTDLGVGCSPRILGVGWHGPPVGCWALDASGEGVGWCWRTPRGDSEVGAQVPQPALIQAPAGSSGPRKVDGGGTGHPGSGSVWSVCENE
jgi:hypothetical protein